MTVMSEKVWLKKTKQLKDMYTSFSSLKKHVGEVFGRNAALVVHGNKITVVEHDVYDEGIIHHARDLPIYEFKGDQVVRIHPNQKIQEIVNVLKDKVSIEKFLEDVLNDLDANTLEEIYERVIERKGKIREEEGCYKLMIGGRRGTPFELRLR